MKKNFFKVLIGTSFGIGYSPVLPGTLGCLPAFVFYWIVINIFGSNLQMQNLFFVSYFILISYLTLVWGKWSEEYWQKKDPGIFVIDEIAGLMLTIILFYHPDPWLRFIVAFILFRIIDMIKIWPAKKLENLHGGLGILLDDLMAAIYAAGIAKIIMLLTF